MGRIGSTAMALLLAALLGGCGGGGGSGSASSAAAPATPAPPLRPPPVTPGGEWLTVTPNPIKLDAYAGEAVAFQVDTIASRSFEKPINVGVYDSRGVVLSRNPHTGSGGLSRFIELQTNALAAGTHSTWIELRFCEDDVAACKLPLPGSPWHIPVTVTVKPAAPPTDRIVVAPASLDIVTQQGEGRVFDLIANLGTFSKPFQMELFDSGGLIENTSMYRRDAARYAAFVSTRAALAPGVHSTTLEVRVCSDDPKVCRQPFPGSPWRIPLTVTVRATPNLTTLARSAELPAWTSYNGNAAHTGHVPGAFNAASFTHRWTAQETPDTSMTAPAIEDGRVYLVRKTGSANWELTATSEQSGELLWRLDLEESFRVSPPAAGKGKVFVIASGSRSQVFWVVDGASGRVIERVARPSWAETLYAPTVVDDRVYFNAGAEEGLVQFDAATRQVQWQNTTLPSNWGAPAADAAYVYVYPGDHALYMLGTLTGKRAFVVHEDPLLFSTAMVPMLAGKMAIAHSVGGTVTAIDIEAGGRLWSTTATGQPAVANGTVYAFGGYGGTLEARAAATGQVQWQLRLPIVRANASYHQVLLTSNLAFASSDTATVAIDLVTRQVAWVHPFGGRLALSDRGVLYIVGANGRLVAINLR